MSDCCITYLLSRPRGWTAHLTYCRCGTLLILRDGSWTDAHASPSRTERGEDD